jgi:hypothetical protein
MALLPRDEIVQLVRINSAWDGMQEQCGTGQGSIDDMLGLLLRKSHGKSCPTRFHPHALTATPGTLRPPPRRPTYPTTGPRCAQPYVPGCRRSKTPRGRQTSAPNFTTIVPVTVCHYGSYVETYSRCRARLPRSPQPSPLARFVPSCEHYVLTRKQLTQALPEAGAQRTL